MKKVFLLLLVTLLIPVTFTSCEKEEIQADILQADDQIPDYKVKNVTLNELNENKVLASKLRTISEVLDINRNLIFKNDDIEINNNEYSFTILTNEIIEVTTESTEAYTFRIKEPSNYNSSFENFVIEKVNNDYRFWIYRYTHNGLGEDFPYSISKEAISENQINLGDFQSYLKDFYIDEATGCLIETYSSDPNDMTRNNLRRILWCPPNPEEEIDAGDSSSGGGDTSSGGGDTSSNGGDSSSDNNSGETGGGGSTGGSSGDSSNPDENILDADNPDSPIAVLEEITYDQSLEEKPCQKEIVENVNNNNSELSNFVLNAFGGSQDQVNLIYKVEDLPGADDGSIETVFNELTQKLNATIKLDTQMINEATDLYIATITLHENLHAVLEYTARVEDLNITISDPSLYDLSIAYARWMNQNGDTELSEHAFMATIVNKIAESLENFGLSRGYQLPSSYYNDLSWSGEIGLNNDTFAGLPFSKKNSIRNALKNERNKPGEEGTPKGQKCE